MKIPVLHGLLAVAALMCGLPASAQEAPGGGGQETVLDGVYTEPQAQRGARHYQTICFGCHEGAEPDAEPPRGHEFVERWREAPLEFLFTFLRTRMPGDAPGSLNESVYLDVLAYLLRESGYPAGRAELTADRVDRILMVSSRGPQPLPYYALVRVVGCLVAESSDAWNLAAASAPARVRVADVTTPEELALSAATPAGADIFQLRNVSGFRPEALAGQRVQAKGVLTSPIEPFSMNVLSLEPADGAGCGA